MSRVRQAALLLVLTSCVTTPVPLTGKAERVVEMGPGPIPPECQRVDDINVQGDNKGRFWGDDEPGKQAARNKLRNAAALLGATHIRYTSMSVATYEIYASGTAYLCGKPSASKVPPTAPCAEPTPCGKDQDCKGARICVAGACSNP